MDDVVSNLIEHASEDAEQPAMSKRPRWMISSRHLYPLLAMIVLLVSWEIIVRVAEIGVWLLPRPSAVFIACFTKAAVLLPAALATSLEILEGFALSIAVGLIMAILIVSNRALEVII